MLSKCILLVATTVTLTISSCRPQVAPDSDLLSTPPPLFSNPLWEKHRIENSTSSVQEDCKPREFKPLGQHRGTVVLLHGFSACPQQYFEVARKFSSEGFRVYLPLLPGHGLKTHSDQKTDLKSYRNIPTVRDGKKAYTSYISWLSDMMKLEKTDEKIIGGLSLGGSIAADAITRPDHPYTKALITTPFFEMIPERSNVLKGVDGLAIIIKAIGGPLDLASRVLGAVVEDKELSWGEGCTDIETPRGRAGYCRYTVGQVILLHKYGEQVRQKKIALNPKVQLIGVSEDPAVSNIATKKYVDLNFPKLSIQRSACHIKQPANHSLLSKFDSPDEDKYWLPALEQNMFSFISSGKHVRYTSEKLDGLNACSL